MKFKRGKAAEKEFRMAKRIMPSPSRSSIALERKIAAISDQRHEKASTVEVVNRERAKAGKDPVEAKVASQILQGWIAGINKRLDAGDTVVEKLCDEEDIVIDSKRKK